MKSLNVIWACFITFLFSTSIFPQVRFSGYLQTSVYTFETPAVDQGNFYQGVQLRAEPESYSKAYFNTYFRVAKRGDADWEERFYNLFADYKTPNDRVRLRFGRQFVYQGVMNGTLDGLLLSGDVKNFNIKLFGGAAAPFSREFKVESFSDNTALGAFASYRFSDWKCKLEASYFQRQSGGNINWHLLGAAFSGKVKQDWYYQFHVDHNLETEKLQGFRGRLSYYHNQWGLWGEYNSQKPRVFEDSYFTIFEIDEYNQFRSGVTYQLQQYQFGAQYLFTSHYIDETNQVILTAGNRWGILGFVFQEGFGGDNVGVYGDVRYPVIPELLVKLYGGYYNFERQTTVISEDATSYSAGLDYRPIEALSLQAELQNSINSFNEDDLRGLFRLFFYFGRQAQ